MHSNSLTKELQYDYERTGVLFCMYSFCNQSEELHLFANDLAQQQVCES